MSYPKEYVADLLKEVDIVRLIGVVVVLERQKNGMRHTGLCPFHQEKTPSFFVVPSLKSFKCFGCGCGGNALQFTMQHYDMEFHEAVRFLAKHAKFYPRQWRARLKKSS